MNKRTIIAFVLLIIVVFLALFVGNSAISSAEIFCVLMGRASSAASRIVFQVRLPRVISAAFSGAALSVSGYLIQQSLNNVIASPGILGINSGAGLFVMISAIVFPYRYGIKSIMAFVGALIVTVFIFTAASAGGMSKSSVILAGVAVSAMCSGLVDVMLALWPEAVADRTAFQLGGFATISPASIGFGVPIIIFGLIVSVLSGGSLDIMALGDEMATGLGADVRFCRGVHIFCAALLTGAAVSMCGIISFVGLLVPNAVRRIYSGKAVGAMIFCAITGAAFLLGCDILSRQLFFPYELPCGLILDLVGAPFLIVLLTKKRKRLGV